MSVKTRSDRSSAIPDAAVIALEKVGGTMVLGSTAAVTYLPILDVARGAAAGFQAQFAPQPASDDLDGSRTARVITEALSSFDTLPTNTFMSLPITIEAAVTECVRSALTTHGGLSGVILDIVNFTSQAPIGLLEEVLADFRATGARISVGGNGVAQPGLASILRLKPAVLRLGRDWVRGIDRSDAKRSAIEVIGRLAGQLDAWILAEGVSTSAELRTLATLEVPLAQGSFIGDAHEFWPSIAMSVRRVVPAATRAADGVLRELIQQAYTATDAESAARVLPETSGFDTVVVVDQFQRPVSILERDGDDWDSVDVLAVNLDTPVEDAVYRAMTRPRAIRFTPIACTDDAGRFVGILRIEKLMAHLARDGSPHRS